MYEDEVRRGSSMEMQLQEASDQIDSYYRGLQAFNAIDTDTVDIVSSDIAEEPDALAWQDEVSTERNDLNVETNSSYYEEIVIESPLAVSASEVVLFKKDFRNSMDLFTYCLVLFTIVMLLCIVMKSMKDKVEAAPTETAETHIASLVTITTTIIPLQAAAEPSVHVPLSPPSSSVIIIIRPTNDTF